MGENRILFLVGAKAEGASVIPAAERKQQIQAGLQMCEPQSWARSTGGLAFSHSSLTVHRITHLPKQRDGFCWANPIRKSSIFQVTPNWWFGLVVGDLEPWFL